jgi:hypothetical protein
MPIEVHDITDLKPGDIYEDCAYHPCLCVFVNIEDDDIQGISLVDGTYPRSCSVKNCGVRKLTVEEAWRWRAAGPEDVEMNVKRRWWDTEVW